MDRAASNYLGDGSTGAKLTALMEERGMSQRRLSALSGVSMATIKRMRSGDMVGSMHSWSMVMRALDADCNEFMKGE